MSKQDIEKWFPYLIDSGYTIESSATKEYNCIAWAAGDTEAWWWPDPQYVHYWPSSIPRTETIEAFIKAYQILGYTICKEAGYESGFEKVAIYIGPNGKPSHVARQLSSGYWTSKLGQLEDIEHTALDNIVGEHYGSVAVILKRPVREKGK